MNSAREIWEAALGELQLQVSKPNYDTWLRETTGVHCQGDVFVVGVPNIFIAEWLTSRLHSLIRRTLTNIMGRVVDVQFVVRPPSQVDAHPVATLQADGGTATKPRGSVSAPRLNPSYTFDTFITGESNRLAYAAALEVTEEPGYRYNPLFIYGDTGTGKTHLLHAIGHAAKDKGHRVLLASAEQFTNQFIIALKTNSIDDFHNKFRSADVLLVDDVQFLSGKGQTQECLLHIFNHLYDNNCQMVITCDRTPRAIASVTKKLKSRLEWGLITYIGAPDFETCLAILELKTKQLNISVPLEVLQFLAAHFQHNVRGLEGALNRVTTYAKLSGTEINMEVALQALADTIKQGTHRQVTLKPELIIHTVASHFGIAPETLVGKRRDRKASLARQVAMYLLRERNCFALAQIGEMLGNRDHTTVLHGCEKIASEITTNPHLKKAIDEIRKELAVEKHD